MQVVAPHTAAHIFAMDAQGIGSVRECFCQAALWIHGDAMRVGVKYGLLAEGLPLAVHVYLGNNLDALVRSVVGKLVHRYALGGSAYGKRGAAGVVQCLHTADGHVHTAHVDVAASRVSCIVVGYELEPLCCGGHEVAAHVHLEVVGVSAG